jgi:uncharacterized membrane protein YhhN
MKKSEKILASVGLGMGAVFGVLGSVFSDPLVLQTALYEISSIGLTTAAAFLAVKFMREQKDFIAAGFLLLAIGEAIMTIGGQDAFAAGMALYIPAFLLISIPKHFPLVVRITGVAASIPFAIAVIKMYMGEEIPSTSPLPGAGYGLLTLTIIGWIWTIMQKSKA